MRKLPEKPSDLILLALEDLEKVEADPRYIVDMAVYHLPRALYDDERCHVCFAGAVMANQVGPSEAILEPHDFARHEMVRYIALDHFRVGRIETGLNTMHCQRPIGLPKTWIVPDYDTAPTRFKESMREIVALLKEHDL